MNDNGSKVDLLKTIMKLKKTKFVFIGIGIIGSILPFCLLLFLMTSVAGLLPDFTSASMVDVNTMYDGTSLVSRLEEKYDLHSYSDDKDEDGKPDNKYSEESAEDNNYFQELRRQKYAWEDDYSQFEVKSNTGGKITSNYMGEGVDAAKVVILTHYRGTVNLNSYDTNYDDGHDEDIVHDDVKLSDYEGEKNVYSRDTRNFYEQAEKRIGSTFFLFPGLREVMGNMIAANITYSAIHPTYALCTDGSGYYCLQNLDAILSDWSNLGNMYMNGESGFHEYYDSYPKLGPYKAASYLTTAINYGYENCLVNVPENDNDWSYLNICNDYKLIFKEHNDYIIDYNGEEAKGTYYSPELLEQSINVGLSPITGGEYAMLPVYEYNTSGGVINSNIKLKIPGSSVDEESKKWFITTELHRLVDYDLYDEYLKTVYIPHLYINCENCNHDKSVETVFNEIQSFEEAYRYFNNDTFAKTKFSGDVILPGAGKIENNNGSYTCNGVSIGISADYVGHKANDLYSGITPVIYPLMEGKVIAVNNTCHSLCPSSDANAYVNRTKSLSELSPACQCGGGWGNYVKVESQYEGRTIYAIYAHLSEVNVSVGQEVKYETQLGVMGTTGVSTGKHLHIELNYTFESGNKFPPTAIFSTESVLSTICGGNGTLENEGEADV